MDQALVQKLERSAALPTLPAIAMRILDLCQSEDVSMNELAKTIASDPALAARMLRMANSPGFGFRREVRTLSHAVALMGVNSVRTLALSFSLVQGMPAAKQVSLVDCWKRSLISAIVAKELASRLGVDSSEEAFLGALLQDIGILALSRVIASQYQLVAKDAGKDHVELLRLEKEAIGANHAQVGAWLLRKWRLPEALSVAIEYSHANLIEAVGLETDVLKLVKIVALSGSFADVWIEADSSSATARLKNRADSLLQLDQHTIDGVLSAVAAGIPALSALFELDLGDPEEVQSVLEQAREALVMLTVESARLADDAQQTINSLSVRAMELENEAQHDGLTGLGNRSRFNSFLKQNLPDALAKTRPLSLVMIDIDHFKKVNDSYGHQAGDKVLVEIARVMAEHVRGRDLAARYGGEEFVLVLLDTDNLGAKAVSERIRNSIEDLEITLKPGVSLRVTVSLGCASVAPPGITSEAALVEVADQALYAAKHGGRNQVRVGQPPSIVHTTTDL